MATQRAKALYKVADAKELHSLILYFIEMFGDNCNLNWIDVSGVTDMSGLFSVMNFNGDISEWDTHNVVTMQKMFYSSKFNGDISKWDVSNVETMKSMFNNSLFNGDISDWNVSNVTDMSWMFYNAEFNGDISGWDVDNVMYMIGMFSYDRRFKGNIDRWKPNIYANTDGMFRASGLEGNEPIWYKGKYHIHENFDFNGVDKKNKHINLYDKEIDKLMHALEQQDIIQDYQYEMLKSLPRFYKVKNYNELYELILNFMGLFGNKCDLNWIDVTDLKDLSSLFTKSKFNGDISKWDVSNATDLSGMFCEAEFNGDISKWNVSNVLDMSNMFGLSAFNGDISKWDVSNVVNMDNMFIGSEFNGDISKWNVSNVSKMEYMFFDSKFNGDISKWDVSNV